MKYCYLVTEVVHDIEFITKLIKKSLNNLKRIQKRSEVDPFWDKLIPKTFPIDDDLLKRVPVPLFLQDNQYSIALHNARGIERIAGTLEESLCLINTSQLFSIGLVLDADEEEHPSARFEQLIQKLSSKINLIDLDSARLGEVEKEHKLRFGVFIIPNNQDSGTLENLLIECAAKNYSNLLKLAEEYIENIDRDKLESKDLKEIKKPAGRKKAIVSIISSVLKPGRAIQTSLQDNRWIDEKTLQLQNIILLKNFIADILGIDS